MKTRGWMTVCAATILPLIFGAAVGRGLDNQKHEKQENRGQSKKHYRQFQEKQRQYIHNYYVQNQNHEVFRPDSRWNNEYANRLQPGYLLDRDMQRMSRPAPPAMIRGLGRAPWGYRYIVIGGHLVLVDRGYRVQDTIRIELNFGH